MFFTNLGVILRQTCFLGIGPARKNFRPKSARPGRIFGPGRPGPEEFSAQVGPARRNFWTKSARPGEIFGQVGPARPGPEEFLDRVGPARPGAKWPRFQTLLQLAICEDDIFLRYAKYEMTIFRQKRLFSNFYNLTEYKNIFGCL